MKNTLLFLFVFGSTICAQNISIKINGLRNSRASLFSVELGKTDFIEYIYSDGKGIFTVPDNGKYYGGFYRILFSNNIGLNFIYDDKDILIEANKNYIKQTLKVKKSDSNKQYVRFLEVTSAYKNALNNFMLAGKKYHPSDNLFRKAKNNFRIARKNYLSFVNHFTQSANKSFISRYIKSAQEPFYNFQLSTKANNNYFFVHFWDNVDFNDIGLLHSDLFFNKIIEYLNYIGNSPNNKSLIIKKYKKAIDVILSFAKINDLVYQQITEYLLNGFKRMRRGNLVDYIVDNFVIADDICIEDQADNFIQMRINQAKSFKRNKKVPDIKLPDANGTSIDLYNIKAEKILILFYSSSCTHCRKFLPKLLKLYSDKNFKKFKIYAISLDTDFNEWQNFIKGNNYNWINVSDLKGWKSKVSYDFYIYSTPTMFLVDNNFKIIDKPKNINDLKYDLLNY